MSTELRTVPDCNFQNELTQTRFWGGKDRMICIQVTQRKARGFEKPTTADGFFNSLQLTREQAGALAAELVLFATSREEEDLGK